MKTLPKIALGTWSWGTGFAGGDQVFGNYLDAGILRPIFDLATKKGLVLWDTAAVYGMGASETILGEFIKSSRRDELILSTKFTPQLASKNADNPVADLLEQSCKRLGTEIIDLYWIHNPTQINEWTHYLVPLLQSGTIKRVGVSNHNLAEIQLVNNTLKQAGFEISAIQNHYSLLYRSSEHAGILDYCKQNNITFFAYLVLEQGALSGKYDANHPLPEGSGRAATYNEALPQLQKLTDRMREIGATKNASVAQIAIAWAIAKGTLPIIGVTKLKHVEDAAAAIALKLSFDETRALEALADQAGVNTKGAWEKPMHS
ncbi:aldo/keto reductase [Sapientia aquatica]|uniref:Aldo/keto reductase n=1 Tax=Sapientia aquatica TaxID=1549640 RepID=A0A4R5W630_9BURK|nr:aldo/keto reductase [Sapientia aquatica]TDK68538.1 aldo/keto reductase [Sapientia aquatica]